MSRNKEVAKWEERERERKVDSHSRVKRDAPSKMCVLYMLVSRSRERDYFEEFSFNDEFDAKDRVFLELTDVTSDRVALLPSGTEISVQ